MNKIKILFFLFIAINIPEYLFGQTYSVDICSEDENLICLHTSIPYNSLKKLEYSLSSHLELYSELYYMNYKNINEQYHLKLSIIDCPTVGMIDSTKEMVFTFSDESIMRFRYNGKDYSAKKDYQLSYIIYDSSNLSMKNNITILNEKEIKYIKIEGSLKSLTFKIDSQKQTFIKDQIRAIHNFH